MTTPDEARLRVEEHWEEQDRMADLESLLQRKRVIRFAAPASFLLFVVLVFVMLSDDILGLRPGSASFAWSVLFVGAYVLGLVLNEVSARRSIPGLEHELHTLRALSERLSLDEEAGPAT